MTPFAAIDFETAGYDRACAFIVRKALERSGTDDIEAMMRTQRQKLHAVEVCQLCANAGWFVAEIESAEQPDHQNVMQLFAVH